MLRAVAVFSLFPFLLAAQDEGPRPSEATLRQWQSRKFGMFIHFGLFSMLGGVWNGRQYSGNYSEQIQSDAHIPEAEYAPLAGQFNPSKWDADAVVQLAIDAGMKFIVLTSKHHDGFGMFASKQSAFNIVDASPYKQDIVRSLAEACRKRGMPFGVYYSSIDWHYGDIPDPRNDNPLSKAHEDFNVAQLTELLTSYGPLAEVWFDMSHPTPLQSRRFANTVHRLQPECLISGRVFNSQGDFAETGDDAIPDYITEEPWESPASIFAETWGYRSWQKRGPLEDKINEHILRLIKVVSHGGNYLLNIGPKGDGSVVDYEADVLRGMGAWIKQNQAAIYGTSAQPFRRLDFGYATVRGEHLYLFVERMPEGNRLRLPGLKNRVLDVTWLGADSVPLKIDSADESLTVSAPPAGHFIPVLDVRLAGDVNVVPAPLDLDSANTLHLSAKDADRLFNDNGEGYYDQPTLRSLRWNFSVPKHGVYAVSIQYAPGKFARLVDVEVQGQTRKALLYGDENKPASAGAVTLEPGKSIVLTIRPAAPSARGAKLDVDITSISLKWDRLN